MAFVEAAVNLARPMVALAAKSLSSPSVLKATVLTSAALRAKLFFAAVVLTPWTFMRFRRKNFTHFAPDKEDARFGCSDSSFDT